MGEITPETEALSCPHCGDPVACLTGRVFDWCAESKSYELGRDCRRCEQHFHVHLGFVWEGGVSPWYTSKGPVEGAAREVGDE